MSIGELLEFLQQLPKEWHHLPIGLVQNEHVLRLNSKRLSFTDGQRYFSMSVMQSMRLFSGVSLEIDANPHTY